MLITQDETKKVYITKCNKNQLMNPFPKTKKMTPLADELVKKSLERAQKHGGFLKDLGWIYGDALYENEF